MHSIIRVNSDVYYPQKSLVIYEVQKDFSKEDFNLFIEYNDETLNGKISKVYFNSLGIVEDSISLIPSVFLANYKTKKYLEGLCSISLKDPLEHEEELRAHKRKLFELPLTTLDKLSFQKGDKVYCPSLSNKVYILQSIDTHLFIENNDQVYLFDEKGFKRHCSENTVQYLFHANENTQLAFKYLYNIDLESSFKSIKIGPYKFLSGETEPPPDNTRVYIVDLTYDNLYIERLWDLSSNYCMLYLERGLVHLSKQDAIKHAQILLELSLKGLPNV